MSDIQKKEYCKALVIKTGDMKIRMIAPSSALAEQYFDRILSGEVGVLGNARTATSCKA